MFVKGVKVEEFCSGSALMANGTWALVINHQHLTNLGWAMICGHGNNLHGKKLLNH